MKKILITRPKNEAQELVEILENSGFSTIIEPIFSVKIIENHIKKSVKTVILTSSNSIPTFLAQNFAKNIKIFTIGAKTAQNLVKKGYKNIVFPKETSSLALKNLILQDFLSKNGKILYFCGNFITLDFATRLGLQGFDIEKILAYEIEYKKQFSDEFLAQILQTNIDFILIFSKNNAKNFYNLAKK